MNMQRHLRNLVFLRQAARKRYASAQLRLASRLAYAYLKKALSGNDIYDVTARLIILEGVANVPEFSWAKSPMQGLRKAAQHFEGSRAEMDPAWFSPKSTGMIKMLTAQLEGFMRRSNIPDMSGEDIVQDALAGLGAYVEEEQVGPNGTPQLVIKRRKIKNKFWEAGNFLAQGILNGSESPGRAAAGALGRLLKNSALNVIKDFKKQNRGFSLDTSPHGQNDEGGHGGVADPNAASSSIFDEIFYGSSPLGQKARQVMRKIIEQKMPSSVSHTMLTWWEAMNRGDFISGLALAQAAGYVEKGADRKTELAATVKVKKHWIAGAQILFEEMKKHPQVQNAISQALEARGVDTYDFSWEDLVFNEKNFGRLRKYGSNPLERLQAAREEGAQRRLSEILDDLELVSSDYVFSIHSRYGQYPLPLPQKTKRDEGVMFLDHKKLVFTMNFTSGQPPLKVRITKEDLRYGSTFVDEYYLNDSGIKKVAAVLRRHFIPMFLNKGR